MQMGAVCSYPWEKLRSLSGKGMPVRGLLLTWRRVGMGGREGVAASLSAWMEEAK